MKILLHICCGVCAAGVATHLKEEGHSVTGIFYNPNIYPEDEYHRRLGASREAARRTGIDLIAMHYDHGEWERSVEGHRNVAEGGMRCALCFNLRLKKTYEHLLENGFDMFTTTLTISPLKDADVINEVGSRIGGDRFLAANFKKKDGFKRASSLAKEWGLYRQGYCGCECSRAKG